MSTYTSATDADRRAMLDAIGVDSIEALFADIPAALRLDRGARPAGRARRAGGVRAPARAGRAETSRPRTRSASSAPACTTHYVPALIDSIILALGVPDAVHAVPAGDLAGRAAGDVRVPDGDLGADRAAGLQRLRLRGARAPSAPAGYLAKLTNGRPRVLASRGVHPHSRETLVTLLARLRRRRSRRSRCKDGVTDLAALAAALGDDASAVVLQQPNFLGSVEDVAGADGGRQGARRARHRAPATRSRWGSSSRPASSGVDIAVGEGQTLGNRLDFGGPSFGFFAAAQEHIRRMPGRIAGETTDVDGRRGFVLTLQTREQHIRREKATSNICTAQALNALAGVDLPVVARPRRARRAGRAAGAADRLRARAAGARSTASSCCTRRRSCASSRSRSTPTSTRSLERLVARASTRATRSRRDYPEYENGLLIAITEQRSRAQIDRLAEALERALIAERATVGAGAGAGA